jgi:putative membrane protein insertion efficiency factor
MPAPGDPRPVARSETGAMATSANSDVTPSAPRRAPRSSDARLAARVSRQVVRGLRLLLRGYRIMLSPLFGPSCRFEPTCSCYADEALEKWGIWRGIGLSAWRILRCHPFSRGGLDPVPPPTPEGANDFGSDSPHPGMKLVGDSER